MYVPRSMCPPAGSLDRHVTVVIVVIAIVIVIVIAMMDRGR